MALTCRLIVSGQIEFSKNILRNGALVFAWYFWFMSVPLIHANTKYSTSNLIWSFAFAAVYFSIKKYFSLAINFEGRKTLKRKPFWTIFFKIRAKIEEKKHLFCVLLRNEFYRLSVQIMMSHV